MTLKPALDAPDRILAALQPDAVLIEHLPASDIEAYPIADVKARLSALGLVPSKEITASLKQSVAETAPTAPDRILAFLESERATGRTQDVWDGEAVRAAPLSAVLEELRRRGINHRAAVRAAKEQMEARHEDLLIADVRMKNPTLPESGPRMGFGHRPWLLRAAIIAFLVIGGGVGWMCLVSAGTSPVVDTILASQNKKIDHLSVEVARLSGSIYSLSDRFSDMDDKFSDLAARLEGQAEKAPAANASHASYQTAREYLATVSVAEGPGAASERKPKRAVRKPVSADQAATGLPSEITDGPDSMMTGSVSSVMKFSEQRSGRNPTITIGVAR